MRTGPDKKKMKSGSEIGERVKKLRTALGMNHEQFAERLRVARPRISEWEAGKGVPTAEAYLALGDVAAYPENLWFLEQAGMKSALILSIANELVKGRVPIPLAHKTPEGIEETQIVVPLPERFVPNPDSTVCLVVDEKSAGLVFAEGDVVVLEPAAEPRDPQPYWDNLVLVEFTEPRRNSGWPEGLFMGKLRCKRYAFADLSYYATVGPLSDSESTWAPGRSESVIIGAWEHAPPPKEPVEGSERAKAEAELPKIGAEYALIRKKYTQGSITVNTPELQAATRQLQEAEARIAVALRQEKQTAKEEAERQAPEELKVNDACKIIGRIVAWFPRPKAQEV